MTTRVRYLQKEAAALQSQQQRIYEHDLRHEEQIKLAGGTKPCFKVLLLYKFVEHIAWDFLVDFLDNLSTCISLVFVNSCSLHARAMGRIVARSFCDECRSSCGRAIPSVFGMALLE